jgi:hypothetical protein
LSFKEGAYTEITHQNLKIELYKLNVLDSESVCSE